MLDAARASVRFCCPECGAGLRAPRADAGTALECHLCGEQVRVPRRPHPVECPSDDAPLVPPAEAAAARSGCRLLTLGLVALVAEYAVLVAALIAWALSGHPAILIAAGVIDLALVTLRTGLKWFGCRRCEPAADVVQAAGWLTAARYAAVVRTAGYAGWFTPMLLGARPNESAAAGAAAAVGQVAWLLGTVGEFAVLLTWFRLLGELGGPNAARRVTVYTVTFAFAVLTVAAGVCLAILLTAAAQGRARPEPPRGLADLPPEGWYGLGGVVALVTAFAVVLGWQYYRILTATRSGMARP
jgi:hypothetical protein